MKTIALLLCALTLTVGFGQDASAYIGPGAGLAALGSFWGLILAVLAAVSFLILWPIRKMFKKSSATTETDPQEKAAP